MRRPLVTTVAVLSLALGIGVNTAIFSVFDRLLLGRLPVPEPADLVVVASPGPRPGSNSSNDGGDADTIFSYALFRDLERVQNVFSGIAAQRDFPANLSRRGQTQRAQGVLVSGGYFSTLGLTPALGRLFTLDDDRIPGGHDLVVLTYEYWATQFGRDPNVLNDTLSVNGVPMTIVGVAPEGFRGTTRMQRPQVFVPLTMAAGVRPGWDRLDQRNDHWLYVFGRLKAGLTRDQAQALFNVAFTALIREVEYPALRNGIGSDQARTAFQARRVFLRDGTRGQNSERSQGEIRAVLTMLFAVTGFVLLIACANVANLLLVRGADRAAEITVRLSLGASVMRLMRLMFAEACLLGAAGAAAAVVVAYGTVRIVMTMMPTTDRELLSIGLNGPALMFTAGLGLLTAILFGLFPAAHGVRAGIVTGLSAKSTRASASRGASRFRGSLAAVQIALATALLAQSGLFIVSLVNISRADLGIDRAGLITFRLAPSLNGYTPERTLSFFDRLEDELRALPGVASATSSTHPLLADSDSTANVTVEGFDAGPDTDTDVSLANVSTDYFRTVGIPVLAGREFTRSDTANRPKVAIVNEAFVRKFNLGSRAIGARLKRGSGSQPLDIQIVGVVRDAKYSQVKDDVPPQLFHPYRQREFVGLSVYVRADADTRALLAAIPGVVRRIDATLPVERLRTMDEQIWELTTQDRILTTLSSSFAGIATVLAAIGLYGLLAYMVTSRVRELGIRMALGATGGDVRRLVFGHVGRITLIGGLIGIAAALGLGRLGEAFLFRLEGVNLPIIATAAAAVFGVALLAGVLPARRAASINPVEALRAE
jgi:putative ABC transport system permease protein